MKKTLLFAAVLCGMTSFAAEPVAVWNGDFDTTEKIGTDTKTYTLSANGNTVAADGSSIIIAGGSTKGIKITLPTNTQEGSVIVKYSNLNPTASDTWALMTMGGGNNTQDSNVDIMGTCCVGVSRAASGIWERKRWTTKDSGAGSYTESGTMAYVYKYNDVARGYANGALIYTADKNLQGSAVYLKHLGIGGKQSGLAPANGTDVTPAIGMKVEAIAVFNSKLTDADVAAYEFPAPSKNIEPLMLLNINNGTAVDGWFNHTQDGGPVIPNSGSLTTNGISFVTSSEGNFYKQRASGTSFKSGEFVGLDGKKYDSISSEVSSSLCLPTGVVFDDSVYNTGVMNGGKVNHAATISGLDDSAKYLLYLGCGRDHVDGNYQSGFKFETAGCASVEELAYVNTDSTSYQAGSLDNDMLSTTDGLLIVRVKGIKPVNGTIQFKMVGDRSSLNFLAVAKVNETEEPGEEEEMVTKEYVFDTFLTDKYQDTGWQVTLDDILNYGVLSGKLNGNWVDPKNDPADGYFLSKVTEDGISALACQLQVLQSAGGNYLKAVRTVLKYDESTQTIWAKATGSANQQNGTVGTNFTNWNGTLAQNATDNGYGVASLALTITKPADKKPQGSIDNVTTAHSDDYSSNTITAAVSIENEGDYKGAAVLVYTLGEAQYVVEIEKGSASITISDLEGGEVYRGTLSLGQKIGEDVTVIEGTEMPVALYQGERQYTWMASPIVIKEATTINSGEGCTAPVPTDMPDYVENCDSVFTVSISAAEAVSEENDTESLKDVQGGVRIAEVGGALKLQVVKNGVWTVFSNAEINKTYAMTVTFHYAKDENDTDPAVSYVLDKTTETSAKMTDKTKVTEVFIADGTVLPDDLTGLFQFDSAVIVDLELEPGDELLGLGETKAEAEAAAAKLKVGISNAVKEVLTTKEAQENYRAYFKVVAVKTDLGYVAQVVFADGVEDDIEKDIAEALDDVVESFNTGTAVKIDAKPGLYYGVKRGETLEAMSVKEDLQMAGADGKVTLTITKPETSKSHFYRIIVSPTPAETK